MTIDIAVLGAGHMGGAILRGIKVAGAFDPESILVIERDAERHPAISELGFEVTDSLASLEHARTVLLCIRPQDFAAFQSHDDSKQSRLIVSVMAGVTIEAINSVFGPHARIARAMPNAPAAIGEGVTAIACGATCTDEDREFCHDLFEGVGSVCDVPESLLSAVTAVAGSGPAWEFLLSEAVREEAIALGLSPDVADTLIAGTKRGAGAMMVELGTPPSLLRQKVITPGGTTEAGLGAMCQAGFMETVRAGVRAAHDRSQELAQGGDNPSKKS